MANVLNTLGKIQEDLGDYAKAEASYRRSCSIMEAVIEDDPDIRRVRVQSLSGLAGILRVQGRYSEAESLFLKASRSAGFACRMRTCMTPAYRLGPHRQESAWDGFQKQG